MPGEQEAGSVPGPVFTSGRTEESVTGWKGTPDSTGRSLYQLRYSNVETLVRTTKLYCTVLLQVWLQLTPYTSPDIAPLFLSAICGAVPSVAVSRNAV